MDERMRQKNKARTWRPISRGSLVRANGMSSGMAVWGGGWTNKTQESLQQEKGEAGFGRVA